jgi:hypothetical protein
MVHKNITIMPSAIDGKGLFANNKIFTGETVLVFEGIPVERDGLDKDVDLGDLFPTSTHSYLIVHEPEILINHSCNPNTGFSNDSTLIALADIEEGEEATFDYSTVGTDGWETKCNCGSKNCRGKISDYKYLPQSIKEKYKDITPEWVLKSS